MKTRVAAFFIGYLHMWAWAECTVPDIQLQVLGSGGPELDDGRASSSYLIWVDKKAKILVDTGPGSSLNFGQTGADFAHVEAILFTHLHVDHASDLPAYIKGSFFTSRNSDLRILGPGGNTLMPATSTFVNRLLSQQGAFQYLSEYTVASQPSDYNMVVTDVQIENQSVSTYNLDKGFSISALVVNHGPVAAVSWRIEVGSCRLVFSGDMNGKTTGFGEFAKQADMLVMHNAIPENAGSIAKNLHMTPTEIGKFSQQAKAKKVIISHRMNRTNGQHQQTTNRIREHYKGPLLFADDLDTFTLQ